MRERKKCSERKETKRSFTLNNKRKRIGFEKSVNYKVVNKYKLGKKQCTGSIIELDQGYCVQIYEANRELKIK